MNSQYLDVTRFRQFKLHKNVDILWDDWEMCFRFETLYRGKLSQMPKHLRPAAERAVVRAMPTTRE